jgi:Sec-independent protein translocase protein TatA
MKRIPFTVMLALLCGCGSLIEVKRKEPPPLPTAPRVASAEQERLRQVADFAARAAAQVAEVGCAPQAPLAVQGAEASALVSAAAGAPAVALPVPTDPAQAARQAVQAIRRAQADELARRKAQDRYAEALDRYARTPVESGWGLGSPLLGRMSGAIILVVIVLLVLAALGLPVGAIIARAYAGTRKALRDVIVGVQAYKTDAAADPAQLERLMTHLAAATDKATKVRIDKTLRDLGA